VLDATAFGMAFNSSTTFVSTALGTALATALLGLNAPAPRLLYSETLAATIKTLLEQRITRTHLAAGDTIAGVIALGGSLARAAEAARIATRHPGARLVVTGASKAEYDIARRLGPQGAFLIEPNARNTYQNAVFTKRLVEPRAGERWIVVTSAVHMPRAMGAFASAGFSVEPWPIYDLNGSGPSVASAVEHEVLGLLAYFVLGRSNAVLPRSPTATSATTAEHHPAASDPAYATGT